MNKIKLSELNFRILPYEENEQYRVNISVKHNGEILHTDDIPMASEADRRQFLERVAKKTGHPVEALVPSFNRQIEDELQKIKKEGENQRNLLIELSREIELFHDEQRNGYALILLDQHQEVLSLDSPEFKEWLCGHFYDKYDGKVVPNMQALGDAINILKYKAKFRSSQKSLCLRLAEHDGKIYVDMGDSERRVIEIDVQGWRVLSRSPVLFKRPPSMDAMPEPKRGGSIDLLRKYASNVPDDEFILWVGYVLSCFNPQGPYAILSITGEQGSGKSTVCRLIQKIIDPNKGDLRSLPRSEEDLMVTAVNNYLLAYDNVSTIPQWLSDALCRLTGQGGYSTRKKYTNDQESFLAAQRSIMLNGIDQAANRPDLLDRMICVSLNPILDQDRKKERELEKAFDQEKPLILGVFLDGVVCALRNRDDVHLDFLPRLADATCFIYAGLPGMGFDPEDFIRAYDVNRKDINQQALEKSHVAEALQNFMENQPLCPWDEKENHRNWEGTMSQLYEELSASVSEKIRDNKKLWPCDAPRLSKELRRLSNNLRRIGIEINFDQKIGKGRTRIMEIQFFPDGIVNLSKNDNGRES